MICHPTLNGHYPQRRQHSLVTKKFIRFWFGGDGDWKACVPIVLLLPFSCWRKNRKKLTSNSKNLVLCIQESPFVVMVSCIRPRLHIALFFHTKTMADTYLAPCLTGLLLLVSSVIKGSLPSFYNEHFPNVSPIYFKRMKATKCDLSYTILFQHLMQVQGDGKIMPPLYPQYLSRVTAITPKPRMEHCHWNSFSWQRLKHQTGNIVNRVITKYRQRCISVPRCQFLPAPWPSSQIA